MLQRSAISRSIERAREASSRMKSLLIIGGSETLSQLFVHIFGKRGWRVEACCDHWDTAIARVAGKQSFDAVILSDSFKAKSAVEMIKLIRSLAHRRSIALVMVARIGEINREAAIAAGADEVLVRPFNVNSLTWVLEKLVVG